MLVLVLVTFSCFLVISLGAPPADYNGRSFKNALNQQGLQTVLQSIEERLRNLDQIYSVRYASASINSDQFIRKIEMLENKLSRMETQIESQLEKISENMSSKNFKDDIAKDQIFRKIDSVYERINHKLSYVEGKMDMDNLKLQTKIESVISKIERLDHSFSVRQADMEAEFSDAIEIMENVKNNVASVENKLINITKNTVESTFHKQMEVLDTKFDNFSNSITQINDSLGQCSQKDVLNDFTNKDVHLSKTFKEYEDQIQNYGSKVNNMYNELWKKSTTIENTMKHSVLLMDLTRKDIQDLKKAGHKFTTYNSQNDGQLEIIVDSFTNTIQRKFAELGRKLESNFENVLLIQNLFLESCHRIQSDENQLENKISLVLEKLLDAVTNRSINTFKEIQSMEELIKSHDSNVYQTLNQNANKITKLSEKTSEDRKKLEKILSAMKKDIGNIVETIQKEINVGGQENNQKYDTIANLLLELQEQVNDLDSRVNSDNINYNSKQVLQDLLLATKSLPDKDTYLRNLTASVEELSNLMKNIYHLLTSSDTKINNTVVDYHSIVNNTTKYQDITNFSAEDNSRVHSDEVTEPVRIVLEIFPEGNEQNGTKNSLDRFNYTLITDETNSDETIENVTIINYYLLKKLKTSTEIPESSIESVSKTIENSTLINQNIYSTMTNKSNTKSPEEESKEMEENIALKGFEGSSANTTENNIINNNASDVFTVPTVADLPIESVTTSADTTDVFFEGSTAQNFDYNDPNNTTTVDDDWDYEE